MEKKVSSYIYIISLFSILILVYSIWVLLAAFKSYKEGNMANFYLQFFIGLIGLGLSLSSISRLKKRLELLKEKMMKVVSVVVCDKCKFKIVRRFETGDYVNKQVGKCQQCDGTMFIDSIYAEKP